MKSRTTQSRRDHSRSYSRGGHDRDPSTDDDDPDYKTNREQCEIKNVRTLGIEKFSNTDKDTDFIIWLHQFKDAVNGAHSPHANNTKDYA